MSRYFYVFAVLALLLSACGGAGEAANTVVLPIVFTVEPGSTPTPTAIQSPTPVSYLSRASAAVETAVPTATPTAIQFPTLSPATETIAPTATQSPTFAFFSPSATTGALPECPTDGEMWEMLGLPENVKPVFLGENNPDDPCHWQWQAYDTGEGIDLPLPEEFQATVTKIDGVVATYRGEDGLVLDDVAGFDLRYTKPYPADHFVHDDCALLAQEMAFGLRRDPSYETVSGNLVCKDLASFSVSSCPVNTAQVAALIGGNADQWTAPDWDKGAWVFEADAGQFIILKVPTSLEGADDVVRLEYWNGQTESAASFNPGEGGIGLDKASFHCHASE